MKMRKMLTALLVLALLIPMCLSVSAANTVDKLPGSQVQTFDSATAPTMPNFTLDDGTESKTEQANGNDAALIGICVAAAVVVIGGVVVLVLKKRK